jgi:hypothetical protein
VTRAVGYLLGPCRSLGFGSCQYEVSFTSASGDELDGWVANLLMTLARR